MLRRLTLLFLAAAALAPAQIWPGRWGEHARVKVQPLVAPDAALWAEYEGEAAEKASFSSPIGPFQASAWRLRDSTSALAWYFYLRPENCTPVRDTATACTTPGQSFVALKNYLLVFEGWRPLDREMLALEKLLPMVRSGGGLPQLPGFLPDKDRVRNSERYLVGVESLARFEPAIPPALAGFEDGGEAIQARFRARAGDLAVTLFIYPTPQVARKHESEFAKQSGWAVHRAGTLVGVVPAAADPEAAQMVLSQVQWGINFMWNQATKPPPVPPVAEMLIAIFQLTGLLLLICIGGGFVFAFVRSLARARDRQETGSEATIIFLRLND